jgi:hypothetical protein
LLIVYKNKLKHFAVCDCNSIFVPLKMVRTGVLITILSKQKAYAQTITLWITDIDDTERRVADGSTGAPRHHSQSHVQTLLYGGV